MPLGWAPTGEILDQGPIEAVYEPYGVVAAILPFNWPPIHFAKKCAPVLAAGNTVVVKPGEQAPLTVLRLVEIANEVLPPGVINAVSGLEAGPALTAHPLVERISFTGATATGRRVLQTAAENITFATMELGGKERRHGAGGRRSRCRALNVVPRRHVLQSGRSMHFDSTYSGARLDPRRISLTVRTRDREARCRRRPGSRDRYRAHGSMRASATGVMGYLDTALREGARIVTQGKIPTEERLRNGYGSLRRCWRT